MSEWCLLKNWAYKGGNAYTNWPLTILFQTKLCITLEDFNAHTVSYVGFSTILFQPVTAVFYCECEEKIDLDSSVLSHTPSLERFLLIKFILLRGTGKKNTQWFICHHDLLKTMRLLHNVIQTWQSCRDAFIYFSYIAKDNILRIVSFLRTLALYSSWSVKQFIEFADIYIFPPEIIKNNYKGHTPWKQMC